MDESKMSAWRSFRLIKDAIASSPPIEIEEVEEPEDTSPTSTFFDAGACFEGNLKLSGDFRIDSEFRGDLMTDGVIVVGTSGSIEGNIEARQVEIEGAVVGNVVARRMMILRASGRLHGDIETACLEIEPRGFFQGATKMLSPLAETRARLDALADDDAPTTTTYASSH